MTNYSSPSSTIRVVKGNRLFFTFVIFISCGSALITAACTGNTDSRTSNTNKVADNLNAGKPSGIASPSIEFILNLSLQEKAERSKLIESLPAFAKAAETVGKFGFSVTAFSTAPDARANPDEGSLTGLVFLGEDSQQIGDHKFRLVFMGPTRDRLDTIRFQSWGTQTKQARQRLQRWANDTLTSLERGKLPDVFVQKLYAGETLGDDGVFNGFCNVQVLQRPINPSRSSADDRISVDLIFDKREK